MNYENMIVLFIYKPIKKKLKKKQCSLVVQV